MKCHLMYICGTLEPGGPLDTLNLAIPPRQPTNIPYRVFRSPTKLTSFIEEMNLNTGTSVNHKLTSGARCPNRHAIYAVKGYKWIFFNPLAERWHHPHPSVDDAYGLQDQIETLGQFEHDNAKERVKLLQEQYNEAMRVFLIACSNLQDELAAGYIANADIAIEVAAARTREFMALATQMHQRQLPQ